MSILSAFLCNLVIIISEYMMINSENYSNGTVILIVCCIAVNDMTKIKRYSPFQHETMIISSIKPLLREA